MAQHFTFMSLVYLYFFFKKLECSVYWRGCSGPLGMLRKINHVGFISLYACECCYWKAYSSFIEHDYIVVKSFYHIYVQFCLWPCHLFHCSGYLLCFFLWHFPSFLLSLWFTELFVIHLFLAFNIPPQMSDSLQPGHQIPNLLEACPLAGRYNLLNILCITMGNKN